MWAKFPQPSEVDREMFSREMARQPAKTSYAILFTPRSGSSWLSDVVSVTKKLGTPGELFNPNFLPKALHATNATNLQEYCDILRRRRSQGGAFGFEITHHQLDAVFGGDEGFLAHFPSLRIFWLVRRDIVAQAVSLYKMQVTGISHGPQSNDETIRKKDADVPYDAAQISLWLRHILAAEERTEALLARTGWEPLRMWYERNMAVGAKVVINRMAEHLGRPGFVREEAPQSRHRKIGTALNSDLAKRFRDEHPQFITELELRRAVTLKGLVPYQRQLARISANQGPDIPAADRDTRS